VDSFLRDDGCKRVYCIYDAPSPDAIRRAAECEPHSMTHVAEVAFSTVFFK